MVDHPGEKPPLEQVMAAELAMAAHVVTTIPNQTHAVHPLLKTVVGAVLILEVMKVVEVEEDMSQEEAMAGIAVAAAGDMDEDHV